MSWSTVQYLPVYLARRAATLNKKLQIEKRQLMMFLYLNNMLQESEILESRNSERYNKTVINLPLKKKGEYRYQYHKNHVHNGKKTSQSHIACVGIVAIDVAYGKPFLLHVVLSYWRHQFLVPIL